MFWLPFHSFYHSTIGTVDLYSWSPLLTAGRDKSGLCINNPTNYSSRPYETSNNKTGAWRPLFYFKKRMFTTQIFHSLPFSPFSMVMMHGQIPLCLPMSLKHMVKMNTWLRMVQYVQRVLLMDILADRAFPLDSLSTIQKKMNNSTLVAEMHYLLKTNS